MVTAKGIGIFLVVLGHCINAQSFLGMWICSFHMPLFFILSGICFNDSGYTSYKQFIFRRINTLIKPLLIFSIIMIIAKSLLLTYDISELKYSLPGGGYWFIFNLFFSELLFFPLNKLIKEHLSKIFILLFCFIACAILIHYKIILPYTISSIFICTFFYGFGFIFKKEINNIINKITSYKIMGKAVSLIALFIPAISVYLTNETIGLTTNNIPFPMVYHILISIIGSMSILLISKAFYQDSTSIKNITLYLGRNTLIILLLHMFFISLSAYYIRPIFDSILLYKLLEQVIIWSLLYISIYLINNRMSWIIGK